MDSIAVHGQPAFSFVGSGILLVTLCPSQLFQLPIHTGCLHIKMKRISRPPKFISPAARPPVLAFGDSVL
ncbi:hypothetical protein P691DRAFT_810175 [Macrolepiota fuliginosa MF-IS2]|uniref:Uncharacterized protein n=1 Tax=Macrolepiota fuliginosa MF-IS2 TaxID=1400762 RepID=A0A9P5XFL8_9AGAR|nr:hypothetical protein P691DRAFT_810175 [Macrolepiota fuliginosa MF-IS2]